MRALALTPQDYSAWLVWLGGLGIALSVLSLLALPWAIARLPADYFEHPEPPARRQLGPLLSIGRQVLGAMVVVAGVVMLVLPGQGLLTILAGLVLMEFPGKRELERRVVERPHVFAALNWLRRKAGSEPLRPVQHPPPKL